MPRKKQAESAKSRRQKLLEYFHSHPRQARFISDVKNELNIKNEQNLRRDLELLAEAGVLEKSKDTSKLPARAVFTLKEGAPQTLKGLPEGDDVQEEVVVTPAKSAPAAKSPGRPPKAAREEAAAPSNGAGTPSTGEDVKGRRSARELEQQIISLLEQQPTTVKDLAEHLKRQQPTVTKALERMQERRLVERKRQGRSFVYSRLSRVTAAAPAAPAAAPAAPAAPQAEPVQAAAAPAHSQPADTGSFGLQNLPAPSVQSIIDAAIKAGVSAGVNAALEHILAGKR